MGELLIIYIDVGELFMNDKFKNSKQLRVFEEELEIVFSKAKKEGVSAQVALSQIIKEWVKYDTVHQSRIS